MPSLSTRLLTLTLCLLALTSLCVAYGAADLWLTPTDETLAQTQPTEATDVFLFIDVESVDHDANTITTTLEHTEPSSLSRLGPALSTHDTTLHEHQITIHLPDDIDTSTIHPDTELQVAGTLEDTTLYADRIVQDYPTQADWHYVLLTSALGLLVATIQFLRYWHPTSTGFTPR